MLRFLAALLILGILTLSQAQRLRQKDIWQVITTKPAITANQLGGGTITGCPFTVSTRADGALPKILSVISNSRGAGYHPAIYRRYATNLYALYVNDFRFEPDERVGAGVLLPPGDYIVNLPGSGANEGDKAVVLKGHWVSQTDQTLDFRVAATVATTPLILKGIQRNCTLFTVAVRPDGALPVIMNSYSLGGFDSVFRKENGVYVQFADVDYFPTGVPGIMLPPGEYAVVGGTPTNFKFQTLLSGYYALP